MNITFSGHHHRKTYFPKSSCSFGSHSSKDYTVSFFDFLIQKGWSISACFAIQTFLVVLFSTQNF